MGEGGGQLLGQTLNGGGGGGGGGLNGILQKGSYILY